VVAPKKTGIRRADDLGATEFPHQLIGSRSASMHSAECRNPCVEAPRAQLEQNPRPPLAATWLILCRWLSPNGSGPSRPKWRRGFVYARARGVRAGLFPRRSGIAWHSCHPGSSIDAAARNHPTQFYSRADRGRLQRHPPTAMLFKNRGHGASRRSTFRLPES